MDFVRLFCFEALKGQFGKSVMGIISSKNYKFAELKYNHINQLGWENNKYTKERGGDVKYSLKQFKEPIYRPDTEEFTEILGRINNNNI